MYGEGYFIAGLLDLLAFTHIFIDKTSVVSSGGHRLVTN